MAKASFHDLDDGALIDQVSEAKDQLFKLRFQLATGQLNNYARIGEVRRDIARLETELRAARDRGRRGDREGERLMAADKVATGGERAARKVREGVVASTAMDKTVVVTVTTASPTRATRRRWSSDQPPLRARREQRAPRRRPGPHRRDPPAVEAEAVAAGRGPGEGEVVR